MPVVPTSQVRVVPQAPRVDIGAFIPPPNPTGGMDLFANAAKLPLMFEQIALEKDRNKLEAQKIKLAEKEAQYMASNFERLNQQKLDAAQLEIDLKTAQKDEAEARAAATRAGIGPEKDYRLAQTKEAEARAAALRAQAEYERPLTPEEIKARQENPPPLLGATMTVGTAPAGSRPLESMTVPATEQAPVNIPPVTTGTDLDAKQVPVKKPGSLRYNVPQSSLPRIPEVEFDENGQPNYGSYVLQKVQRDLSFLPTFTRGSAKDYAAYEKSRAEEASKLLQKYQPKKEIYEGEDETGMPFKVEVLKIGDDIVDRLGPATLNTSRLHYDKEGKATPIKTRDDEFAKRMGGMTEENRANSRARLGRLSESAELLAKAQQNPSLWRSAIETVAFLTNDEKLQALLGGNLAQAQNEVRRVVQENLRETLGGAFAMKEGEAMMNRSFQPLFSADANFRLIGDAIRVAQDALAEQEGALQYFEDNGGTIHRYRSSNFSVDENGNPTLSKAEQRIQELRKQYGDRAAAATQRVSEDRTQKINNLVNVYGSYSAGTQ